jgi:hypothetical protein
MSLTCVRTDRMEDKTDEYATVPTSAYAISAPSGPAPASACPEPRNRPVPIVPAIAILNVRLARASLVLQGNEHLYMALFEPTLHSVKVMRVERVVRIGLAGRLDGYDSRPDSSLLNARFVRGRA